MNIKPYSSASAAAYLEQTRSVVTPQRFAVAVDAIFRRAERDGDLDAFRAVAPYVVGPMRMLEESGADETVTRIIAIVEKRRELFGDKKFLDSSVGEEIDGEYTEEGMGTDAENEEGTERE